MSDIQIAIMKTMTRLFLAVAALPLVFAISAAAQSKKDLLHMIENQNTSINNLNQQIGALTVRCEQADLRYNELKKQHEELKKQHEELKALIAATNESKFVNIDWTKKGDFVSGLALVQDDNSNRFGFIDKTGQVVIPCKWKGAGSFNDYLENCAPVQNEEGLWGFIDKTGIVVFPCKWKTIHAFNEILDNCARVQNKDGLWGLIDITGKEVIPCKWEWIGTFNEYFDGLADVMNGNNLYGFIDKTGKLVIPCKYSSIFYGSNGLIKARTNGRPVKIDRTGKEYSY